MQIDIPLDVFTFPDVPLPEVWTIEQQFQTPGLSQAQIEAGVRQAVEALGQDPRLHSGARVAVGVGSRGLDNLVSIVHAVVGELKQRGCAPFIVPAMGSHGGATADGQTELLHGYGITPDAVGADIYATMEVDDLGTLEGPEAGPFAGHTVFYDRNAHAADAVILINRIKAHTDFTGDIESGIAKMCAIGLGKRRGAESIHHYGAYGLRELMPRVARYMARHANIVGGVALIENELGQTAEIHALPAEQVGTEHETALLRHSREIMPRLPFAEIDVLIIDEMGKNISGAGMDTHVIGRGIMPSIPESEWGGPNIRLIAVLDLTTPSHGNATALGLADLTTRKLIEKIDFTAMLINMRTSGEGGIQRGRLPLILSTGDDCVRTAIATCGKGDYSQVRFVRIRNTADTRYLEISQALLEEARAHTQLRVEEHSHALDLCQEVRPL